jgi:hypothetical protein
VSEKWSKYLPYAFMAVAALSRWPNLFPPNFSAFYALAFCAGAFFPRSAKWWLPLGTLVFTDVALDLYYSIHLHINAFSLSQLINYAAFGGIIWFGGRFSRRSSFLRLLSGGIIGAIFFYLLTNTAAWLTNPEYSKDLAGWIIALTKGTNGHPTTLEFFRNSLTSGGLFTGLFAGAMKLSEAPEPADEKEPEEEPAQEPEGQEQPESQDA